MPAKLPLSEERVVDSSGSDVETDTASSPAKPAIPQQKQKQKKQTKPTTVANSTTKPSSKSSTAIPKSSAKLNLDNHRAVDSDASDSSTTSSSTSPSKLTQKRPAPPIQNSPVPARKKQKLDALEKVTRVEPRPYFPPPNYTTVPSAPSDHLSSEITHLFNNNDIHSHNKQIWHITAPASLDLSTLTQFVLSDVLASKPLLEHDNVAYALYPHLDDKHLLLLPDHDHASNQYKQATAQIKRSFHLRETTKQTKQNKPSQQQQRIRNTHGDANADADADADADTVMVDLQSPPTSATGARHNPSPPPVFFATVTGQNAAPRMQPPGLRARWLPYGAPVPSRESTDRVTNGIALPPAVDSDSDTDADGDGDETGIQPVMVQVQKQKQKQKGQRETRKQKQKQKEKKVVETIPGTDVMDVILETGGREKIGQSGSTMQSEQEENESDRKEKKKRKKEKGERRD